MKILYAIQGTGNGHITVARDLIPRLKEHAEVDILVSGYQVDISLPFEIKYKLNGLCFIFGKKGGIDYLETYKRSKLKLLFKEILSLPVEEYDLIISDFEPVSSWACYLKNIPCVGLSHQAAVITEHAPRPAKTDMIGKAVLQYYAPVKIRCGFHYLPYDKGTHTPIIRQEVRQLSRADAGHYTVYLPSFSDKRIIKFLLAFPQVQWQVFSKHSAVSYEEQNISICPVTNDAFLESMASSRGVLCGSGFQTPAEVLFLKKKLIVIPMKGQYEQQCNAAALKALGVPVLKNLKMKRQGQVKSWLEEKQKISIRFPDISNEIVSLLLHKTAWRHDSRAVREKMPRFRTFRELILRKIFYKQETALVK
jgi:uncharacterized protein (TIGR00661 family)